MRLLAKYSKNPEAGRTSLSVRRASAIFLKYSFTLLLSIVFAAGCAKDGADDGSGKLAGEVKLRLLVHTPAANSGYTRAVTNEEALTQATLLVLEDSGNGLELAYIVTGYSLGPSQNADYEFLARVVPSQNRMKIYVIGNGNSAITSSLTPGMTEAQIREAVNMPFTSAGFDGVLPMTGEINLPSGLTEDATLNTILLRSAARVDVRNTAPNFTLTSVRVYRATDMVQLIPDAVSNNIVTSPSIPQGASRSVELGPFSAIADTLTRQVYIPESAMPVEADRTATATVVVVGGRFAGDTNTTYYRMDFVPNETPALFGLVLRNHRYEFRITEVLAPGWTDPDDAAIYPSSQIEADIVVWNDATTDMVFDGANYLGLSRRAVRVGYSAGSTQQVQVQTDVENYRAWWGNADGTYNDASPSITFGGDFDNPSGLYNAEISGDGSVITFTALANYNEATAAPGYLVLVAGRLRIVITVTQGPPNYGSRTLSIFNSTRTIGSIGNFYPGQGWLARGDRTHGLGNMLVGSAAVPAQNFGPGKTVDMGGIYLSGVNLTNSMPRNYYDGMDVLYLSFDENPPQNHVDSMINWLAADTHRILIVLHDNAATNNNMMTTLGLANARNFSGALQQYSYAGAAAPDFVRSGPFGTVNDTFSYKCQDDTYGALEPNAADALGYIPILLSNGSPSTTGYYVMSVNPERRIILCGDCDIWTNLSGGSGTYYLNIGTQNTEASFTVDPGNPAHVTIANLWAWIVDVALAED